MTQSDFSNRRRAAIEPMRQMNERSVYKKQDNAKPEPIKQEKKGARETTASKGFNLPFSVDFLKDSDSALIIGLLLILLNEKSDKTLLFALVYILL